MSLLGRLIGSEPPKLPDGALAYVDGYGPLRRQFCVRVRAGPDLSPDDKRIGPAFETATGAAMYADFCNGVAPLDWNVNGVGMSV